MFRKIRVRYLSIILFLVIIASFSIFAVRSAARVSSSVFRENTVAEYPTIILDAGHGGEDGGAQAEDGTLEKAINLIITLKLKDMLLQSGFNVITTRESDVSIGDQTLSTVRERKVSDLKNRLAIFNKDENNIVISIHQNKFSESKYHGTQIFYSPKNPDSTKLAEYLRNAVVSLLQPENTRECKAADKNIYVLYNADVPAVIVECGFLSNPQELENLKQDDYQQKTAFSIYLGFLEYYAENRK